MKELITLQKELRVRKDNAPSNNRYKYRKVDDILRAVKECDIDNIYIVLSDDLVCLNDSVYTKGTATIHNGETSVSASSFAKEGTLPGQSDPQISGSCSTYARKKALEGLLALDDGNDPDGNPLPDNRQKPQDKPHTVEFKKVTEAQIKMLNGYMKDFTAKNDSKAVEYIAEHLVKDDLSYEKAQEIIRRAKDKA